MKIKNIIGWILISPIFILITLALGIILYEYILDNLIPFSIVTGMIISLFIGMCLIND